jgi:hypothetical protein
MQTKSAHECARRQPQARPHAHSHTEKYHESNFNLEVTKIGKNCTFHAQFTGILPYYT